MEYKLDWCPLDDSTNSFNKTSRLEWPADLRFAFNCYWHFLQLLIRVPGEQTLCIIMIREGVKQGDPMAMLLYGASMAVLYKKLKT